MRAGLERKEKARRAVKGTVRKRRRDQREKNKVKQTNKKKAPALNSGTKV